MVSIIGGLGAALLWAGATVCSSRSSRMLGAPSTLAWVMIVGLVVTLPALLASGVPANLDRRTLGWLFAAGAGNVLGLLLEYRGFHFGKVGLVAPIASTEGAIAAILAVLVGERISPAGGVTLAVIAAGVALAALTKDGSEAPADQDNGKAALFALAAAVAFGIGIYAAGRVSQTLPLAWAALPARAVGVAAVAIPLALTARLRFTRRAAPLLVTAGICEVVGFVCFAIGARHGIAVTSVLGSQFAAFSVLGAWVLFHERLSRIQLAGVAMIVVGVAALSGLTAAP